MDPATRPFEIIPADRADAEAILALQRLVYQSEARLYDDWGIPPLTQTLAELRAEFATLMVLKAVPGTTGSGIVGSGTISSGTTGSDTTGSDIIGSVRAGLGPEPGLCRIGRLIVHPGQQRQGLGTALLRAAEAAFPAARRFQLFTGHRSEGNLRLYQRLGYRIVRSEAVSPGLTLVFLEREA